MRENNCRRDLKQFSVESLKKKDGLTRKKNYEGMHENEKITAIGIRERNHERDLKQVSAES